MYEFSIGSFFVGLLIVLVGVAFVRWHQAVANNFGNGIASYDKYKLYAIGTCVVGLIVMVNLHEVILRWIISFIVP